MLTRREIILDAAKGSIAGLVGLTMSSEASAADHKPTALLLDPIYKHHDPGPGHPEQPARYDAVTRAVDATGVAKSMTPVQVRVANEDEIALVHDHKYIALAKREIAAGASSATLLYNLAKRMTGVSSVVLNGSSEISFTNTPVNVGTGTNALRLNFLHNLKAGDNNDQFQTTVTTGQIGRAHV